MNQRYGFEFFFIVSEGTGNLNHISDVDQSMTQLT